MKFIHAADLHIDSPLKGLESYEGAPLEQLQGATRVAFDNLVRLAVDRQVDFIVIAGDLFDGKWQDMRTGLWTASRFRELDRAGIRVVLLQGNHDAASKVRHAVSWPRNVHVFSVKKPESIVWEELGVALHGQGFAREKTTTDLAAEYPAAVAGLFNIGVLHTCLTGSPEHDNYAPTNVAVLVNRGYDYWALGHVHARSDPPIQTEPYIAFSGNLQGRHIKETGPKGCLVVTVDDGLLSDVEFVATDTLRWHLAEVELQASDGRAELLDAVERQIRHCQETSSGRFSAIRLIVKGACEAHRQLTRAADRAETVAEIRNRVSELSDEVWVEKIVLETRVPVDTDQLLQGQDLVGELLRLMRAASTDPASLAALAEELKPLSDKAAAELREAGLELDNAEQLQYWLERAEALLVGRLMEADR